MLSKIISLVWVDGNTNHPVCICICVSLPCEAHKYFITRVAKGDFDLAFSPFSPKGMGSRGITCNYTYILLVWYLNYQLLKPISWGINSIGKKIYVTKFA